MTDYKEQIKDKLEEYLHSKGIDTSKPFLCLNPEHIDHTPNMSITPSKQHVKCFSCNAYYDIFDLIGIEYNLSEFTDQLIKACEVFHLDNSNIDMQAVVNNLLSKGKKEQLPIQEVETDYIDYFNKAHANLEDTNYPTEQRGLSIETLNKFNIGYDPEWKHPKAPQTVQPTPRLIIPTSNTSYLARAVISPLNENEKKYAKSKVGKVHIFNLKAIKDATSPVVIVEGELDAMSIIDVGGESIGLGSTSNINKFLSFLQDNKPKQPLIIALDNDKAGVTATQKLKEVLTSLSLPYMDNLTFTPSKDANELLFKDKEDLTQRVEKATKEAIDSMQEEQNKEITDYEESSVGGILNTYLQDIRANKSNPIPTGYSSLDYCLNGGLVGGLYGIGAISSLGKTTFILQMADQIAKGGKDVLIFSLEMNKKTLIAKSLSRIMYQQAGEPVFGDEYSKQNQSNRSRKDKYSHKDEELLTSQGILQGCTYKQNNGVLDKTKISTKQIKALEKAVKKYSTYGSHLHIFEPSDLGNGFGVDIEAINKAVERHISLTGNNPVVIIDYLQLIQPSEGMNKGDNKYNTDQAIHGLKVIADSYNTPVIAISSFNRNSYNAPVNLSSFKESGNIEYSCDVLIGLQFDLDYGKKEGVSADEIVSAKKQPIGKIQAVILKNRNGATGNTLNYSFAGAYNTFKDETDIR